MLRHAFDSNQTEKSQDKEKELSASFEKVLSESLEKDLPLLADECSMIDIFTWLLKLGLIFTFIIIIIKYFPFVL